LQAFLGAELTPGFDLFARHAGLERRLRAADLVITGEGAIDSSTLMGKGVGQIAERCRRMKIPCIGLGGVVSVNSGAKAGFARTHALTELTSVRQAKAQPARWLERLAEQVALSVHDAEQLYGPAESSTGRACGCCTEIRRPKSENGLSLLPSVLRARPLIRTSDFGLLSGFDLWEFRFAPSPTSA
jgi:hypothetical protein